MVSPRGRASARVSSSLPSRTCDSSSSGEAVQPVTITMNKLSEAKRMRRGRAMVGPIVVLCFACGPQHLDRGTDYDYVLRNGLVVDGTGGTPYRGDVAIKG